MSKREDRYFIWGAVAVLALHASALLCSGKDYSHEAAAALALADSKPIRTMPKTYQEALAQAEAEKLPLIVWVGPQAL